MDIRNRSGNANRAQALAELGVHVRGAINSVLTKVEIWETIVQGAVYCGVSAGVEVFEVLEEVLDIMAEKGEFTRQLGSRSLDGSTQ